MAMQEERKLGKINTQSFYSPEFRHVSWYHDSVRSRMAPKVMQQAEKGSGTYILSHSHLGCRLVLAIAMATSYSNRTLAQPHSMFLVPQESFACLRVACLPILQYAQTARERKLIIPGTTLDQTVNSSLINPWSINLLPSLEQTMFKEDLQCISNGSQWAWVAHNSN